ncbi:MAG: ATP-dependent helicase RecG [Actinomycetota bacterium]
MRENPGVPAPFPGVDALAVPPRPRTWPDPALLGAPLGGPKRRLEGLHAMGLHTRSDLLEALPFRFEDLRQVRPIAEAILGGEADVTVIGRVGAIRERPTRRRGLRILQTTLSDETGSITLTWFNQRQLARTLEPGARLVARGTLKRDARGADLAVRSHELLEGPADAEPAAAGGLVPVYHASARVSTAVLRGLVDDALRDVGDRIPDPLPVDLRVRHRLPLRRDAITAGHRPRRRGEQRTARRRLAYEELLLLQLALLLHRDRVDATGGAAPLGPPGALSERFRTGLPFALTGAQQRALDAIDRDLDADRPMQRLLEGDVGSGKTVVAFAALVRAVEHGGQAALMAPTEVLALQHLRGAERLLEPLGIEVAYLSGDVPERERRVRRARIEAGEPLVAIGTHALLHTAFPRLEVLVVDEQHRFGVAQRARLAAGEGPAPHVLHMTATPIPRSLALTAFGDLDLTVIDELPPGRQPVRTSVVPEAKRADGYAWIVEQVRAGRQAYVVCPLVEESAEVEARAAEEEAARLAAGPLAAVRVACAHGQQPAAERQRVMAAFAAGDIDVLVATTVIEVGVDVPNATVMVIEDADRFGLAQLHQLRGRVGRGAEQSYCLLYASAEPTPEGEQRLDALVRHRSGFELAEIDLAMRGEGRLLGLAQSGASDLRHARLDTDRRLLERAREDAAHLVREGPDDVVRAAAEERFGELIAALRRA